MVQFNNVNKSAAMWKNKYIPILHNAAYFDNHKM